MENVKEKTRVISAVLKGIGWLEDNISALFLGSAILLLFYEVLARYFFNTAVYVSCYLDYAVGKCNTDSGTRTYQYYAV